MLQKIDTFYKKEKEGGCVIGVLKKGFNLLYFK